MRVELFEKIADISDDEKEMMEKYAIEPKDKRWKWRRVWFDPSDIFSLREVSEKESIIEFNDGCEMVVKGDFSTLKKLIEKAEAEED